MVIVEIGVHLVAIVAHQSVACTYPYITFLVLCHGLYLLMGQSVLTIQVTESVVAALC